eukprot:1529114-Prymnesium_polylepis.1
MELVATATAAGTVAAAAEDDDDVDDARSDTSSFSRSQRRIKGRLRSLQPGAPLPDEIVAALEPLKGDKQAQAQRQAEAAHEIQ